MSETLEEEMRRKEEEARKYIAKRKKGEKTEIEVTVDTSSMETLVGKIKDLEPQARGFKDLAQNLARKCRDVGLDVDSNQIKSAEDFKDMVQKLYQKKEENEGIPVRVEKKGGEGQVPLSMQSGSGSRSYDSVDEMIDDLRSRASAKTQEGEEAQAILDEFWRKSLSGQKELKTSFKETEYHGKRKPSGKEKGVVETLNEQFRKRRKERKQHEEKRD